MNRKIPVFLFTGFLDSGKTTFISETVRDDRFERAGETILILCEEGEEEFDRGVCERKGITVVSVEREDTLKETMASLAARPDVGRVIVEYNGMWMIDTLFAALPEQWGVVQEMALVDASTFLAFNANMRSLVVDKFSSVEMVLFNRCDGVNTEELHKIVRATGRNAAIAYQYRDGRVENDTYEDPLPFDLDADVVEINDEDYAVFYRDLSEELDRYNGKTLKFSALAAFHPELPRGYFLFGRQVMTCCVDDMQFAGLLCRYSGAAMMIPNTWYEITAKVSIEENEIYGRPGPVLTATHVTKREPPANPVATFY